MRKLLLALGMLVIGGAHAGYDDDLVAAKKMDELNHKLYGTCTIDVCYPGKTVEAFASDNDSAVLDSSGNPHPLVSMKGQKFKVIEIDKVHPGLTWVKSGNERYQFQRIELKPIN